MRTKQQRAKDTAESPLTNREFELLKTVQDGVDVWSPLVARDLRKLDAKRPGLLNICKAMQNVPGHMQQPYFGCITTRNGVKAIENEEVARALI